MTIANNVAAKLTVAFVASAMLFSLAFAPVANAQTNEELQAQITALLAQIAALQGQISGGGSVAAGVCPYTWTRDLSSGSTGADVMKLQQFLNADAETRVAVSGAGSAGMETQYYGPATAAAVSKFQVKYRADVLSPLGLVNPTGYFGAGSRDKANSLCQTSVPVDGDEDEDEDNGDLEGGAGSIDDADYISGLNNEEVGEGQRDVEVAGLEIEAGDGSDIEITAVNLNFSKGSGATRDFDRYATEVTVWFDGDEIASLDADEFTRQNNYDKTISLDSGAIIRAGNTGELVVAVSGVSNLDTNDNNDEWTVEFESVRFRDAQGAIISDTTTGDINDGSGRTFKFVDFATATDVELRIHSGDEEINDARVIEVHDTDDTDGVELFSFELEARGDSDITIYDMPMLFTADGAEVDQVANTFELWIDGSSVDSINVPSTATAASLLTFDDIDYTIDAGDRVEVVVKADINDLDSNFTAGDTLMVAFGEAETDNSGFDVEDAEGNALADADKTGSATSDAHAFYATGIQVALVSLSESATVNDSATDDTGTFTIKYDVTAFGGDVWVSKTGTATTVATPVAGTSGVFYRVDHGGTATVAGLGDAVTVASGTGVTDTGGANGVKIEQDRTASFTLTVTRTNTTANGTAALFRTSLEGIAWEDDAAGANEFVYTFDLDDFETDYIFLN